MNETNINNNGNCSNGSCSMLSPLQSALSSNLEYAASLKKQLNSLRGELLLNLEKQRLLKANKLAKTWSSYSSQRRCAMVRREKFFSTPHHIFFISKIKHSKMNEYKVKEAPMNCDTKYWGKKSKINLINLSPHSNAKECGFMEYVPVFHLSKNVSKMEKNIIITSARCEYIEKAKKRLMRDNNDNDIKEQNRLRVKLMSLDECVPADIDGNLLDWKRISRYLIGKHVNKLSYDISMVKHRESAEYSRIWNNYILSDTCSYDEEEIECLSDIVLKYGGYNWISIYREFNETCVKNRSMLSLLRYYQQHLNTIHTKHDWTRSDDEILMSTAKEYGENDVLSQSFHLDRRLPHQCYSRFQHATGTQQNVWTESEDLMLILLMKATKNIKWSKAKQYLVERSDGQCRDRYLNSLKNFITINDIKLNLVQIIFICGLLYSDKDRLWSQWTHISYVINCEMYNYWDDAIKARKKRSRSNKKRYSQRLMKLKKKYITNHKYHDPSAIAYLFCILFGGENGHKLFYDEDYCRELLLEFKDLKRLAIQCQHEKRSNKRKKLVQTIDECKHKISQLVNHPKFRFDELIQDVVDKTVFWEGNVDLLSKEMHQMRGNKNEEHDHDEDHNYDDDMNDIH